MIKIQSQTIYCKDEQSDKVSRRLGHKCGFYSGNKVFLGLDVMT